MTTYNKKTHIFIEISIKTAIFDQNFDKMSIGKKVRQRRELKGLSQADLAIMADISQSTISSLESDKTIPNSIMLNSIAKVLEVDISELLKDDCYVQNNYASGNYQTNQGVNNTHSIPELLLATQQKYIEKLEAEVAELKDLLGKLNS